MWCDPILGSAFRAGSITKALASAPTFEGREIRCSNPKMGLSYGVRAPPSINPCRPPPQRAGGVLLL